jgi:hypothetical protein
MVDIDKPDSVSSLARKLGVSPKKVRNLAKDPTFPLIDGMIWYSDFVDWRKIRLHHGISSSPASNAVDKSCEPIRLNDLPASSPVQLVRLRASYS